MNFEENMNKLETIVKRLERGDSNLDGMLALFEEGVKLTKDCNKLLDEAEQKINILSRNENDEIVQKRIR